MAVSSSRTQRTVFALAVFSAMPLLVACPKKEVPVADAAPPPAPEVDAAPLVLTTLDDDAGDAGDAADAAKKATGPGVPTNVARLRQCCGQLRTQAKALGASPEAGFLTQSAAQCDQLAAQAGPGVNAPELGILKAALAGRNIPPICAGF
ncbi:MAG: hypothetical protein JWO86_8799 [Myxococcaceae bacterium]|jgi:hypothetical protein|nr:hypothetical protein [Myxococcaceae bacterium]MEA2753076.1 hypothetical protein [Myxococcales bacterium]